MAVLAFQINSIQTATNSLASIQFLPFFLLIKHIFARSFPTTSQTILLSHHTNHQCSSMTTKKLTTPQCKK